ncbi:hypothetical protein [Parabacteroides sp. AM08-6]|uniref:hypothetical protein n=1 Tax=Parabacteroides sp. AM08-6 TaxID=2292053 RepID=UPI000EFEEFF8|nr:hypothetical protein [Parabacteroides sp. AM08-6]RHJ75703.1 hypothetical protein DW103_17465 [Parabacteroides sp. AM08-6]
MLEIISLLIITAYTTAVCIKQKGIPYSISATFYKLEHKLIFGASMCLTALFLFPVVWELSTTFTMRLLAIAACIGLIGVGLAPDFRDEWINKIHCGSAALTLISSQLWVGCTPYWWVLIPIWLAFIVYTVVGMSKHVTGSLWQDFVATKPMFWCEIAALGSTYLAIFLMQI